MINKVVTSLTSKEDNTILHSITSVSMQAAFNPNITNASNLQEAKFVIAKSRQMQFQSLFTANLIPKKAIQNGQNATVRLVHPISKGVNRSKVIM